MPFKDPARAKWYQHYRQMMYGQSYLDNKRKTQRIREILLTNRPTFWLCELCNRPISGFNLVRDHNHKTNSFRGWLCRQCNTALGWFENRKQRIEEYVR